MIGKLAFFALGYVLGTRAGRDQLRQLTRVTRAVLSTDEAQTMLGLAGGAVRLAIDRGADYATRRAV